jgi:hypothetical protein
MDAQLSNLQGAVNLDELYRSTLALIRSWLRDFAQLNLLLEREETDEKTLLMCLQMAVVDVNATPPPTSWPLRTMIDRAYIHILTYGTTVYVMESLMILETRNHLNWQEGGQALGLMDRSPMLEQRSRYFRDVFETKLKQKKISDSINDAMGIGDTGVHSEYWLVNGWLWTSQLP